LLSFPHILRFSRSDALLLSFPLRCPEKPDLCRYFESFHGSFSFFFSRKAHPSLFRVFIFLVAAHSPIGARSFRSFLERDSFDLAILLVSLFPYRFELSEPSDREMLQGPCDFFFFELCFSPNRRPPSFEFVVRRGFFSRFFAPLLLASASSVFIKLKVFPPSPLFTTYPRFSDDKYAFSSTLLSRSPFLLTSTIE